MRTIEEIARLGGHAIAVRCDHANDDEVDALFARVSAEHGRLDVMVNNAFRVPPHMDPRVPFWETPISDWDALIDVGTRSAYTGTHHAARMMIDAGRGLIVNVSSASAIRYFHHLAYGVGKAALDRITKEAARPLATRGVTIVSIWPYLVRTETVMGMPGIDPEITESTRFSGRAIVALATDPDVQECTGRAFTTRDSPTATASPTSTAGSRPTNRGRHHSLASELSGVVQGTTRPSRSRTSTVLATGRPAS